MIGDKSSARRLELLTSRIEDLERQVEGLSQVSAAPAAPRDIWLGRTVAGGQTYPTSGNTFRVELIRGDFATFAGDTDVTEHRRGTIITAHTWPDAYIPEDSQVIVMRIRGKQGPGEWWIETHSVDLSTLWAEMVGGYNDEQQHPPWGNAPGGAGSQWGTSLFGHVSGPAAANPSPGAVSYPVADVDQLSLAIPGQYEVDFWAHVYMRPAYGYDGITEQEQHVRLTLLQLGAESGRAEGTLRTKSISSAGQTIHGSCRVSTQQDATLRLFVWGSGLCEPGALSVWRWRLFAVRIGD